MQKIYYLFLFALCLPVIFAASCSVSHCKTCYYNNSFLIIPIFKFIINISTKCSTCDSGYYRSSSYKCYSCPNACKTCSNYSYCTSCESGYTLTTSYSTKSCTKVKLL